MPGNFKQYDLRIIKTHKGLLEALPKLLSQRNFGRITVNDICEESQISRTAFYSHFNDKYDLLKCWLPKLLPKIAPIRNNYTEIEKNINQAIENNRTIIINLLEDANNETKVLLKEFITSFIAEFIGAGGDNAGDTESFDIILYNFCAGGMLNLLLWQIENRFPPDLRMVNIHIYKILDTLRQLKKNKSDGGVHNGE